MPTPTETPVVVEREHAPVPAPQPQFTASFAGATLVVAPPQGPGQAATALARGLPVDRGRTVVVVDFPPGDESAFWPAVAAALKGRGPVRLMTSHAGTMRPTAPAQWLAEQLQAEVVAADGAVTTVPGAAFVVGNGGYGSWLRFLPGASPMPMGRRFPVPQWEAVDPNSPWPTGEVGISEPIPAGLWLRAQRVPFDPAAPDARAVVTLPCRDNVLTVVVGGPGQPPIPVEEVCRLLGGLSSAARSRVRLVWYGGEHQGQEVADQLGEPIALYSGLPVAALRSGAAVVAVNPRGQQTWRPYVTEVSYTPGGVPSVSGYRVPVPGLVERGPGVFDLGGGVVLEVVPSGLWVRDAEDNGPEVRALPVDPEWARLTVGSPGKTTAGAVAVAGASLVERLEPEVRRLLKVVFCDPTPAPQPPMAEPEVELPEDDYEPVPPVTDREPTVAVVHHEPAHHEPAHQPVAHVPSARERLSAEPVEAPVPVHEVADEPVPISLDGPLPQSPAPVWGEREGEEFVPADHRSTEAERDALRRMLGERYAAHAAVACRHIEVRPEDPEAFEAVVTDLAAVSACLQQDEEIMVEALRTGRLGRLWPYAAGVVSGLRRLPVHQGVTVCWGDSRRYRTGDLLVEHGVLSTVAGPSVPFDGRTEFVIWSVTGRRVQVVDSFGSVVQERVVFPPGTTFKVLAVAEAEESAPMQVMLQEVAGRHHELPPGVLGSLERAAVALRTTARAHA
ncbi:hypothetical protein [Saccharothrix variisporea]|uniref:NAD(+)--protein-arginine ADP-ribosyltransferase n=1 Tax=Saccharothrix variisporea TaxID=543527 RepID=A0A495X686_9PSEU|nr:hypothetical protein [Saccharothrix variisporea]RKT68173.1 hypothetical protein DFJ66_1354 [Saccharothrix variisporea]